MKVITVRKLADNSLVCFGPDNGQYDPGVPDGCIKSVEPDYPTVLAAWTASKPAPVDKRSVVLADARIPQWFKDWLAD